MLFVRVEGKKRIVGEGRERGAKLVSPQ